MLVKENIYKIKFIFITLFLKFLFIYSLILINFHVFKIKIILITLSISPNETVPILPINQLVIYFHLNHSSERSQSVDKMLQGISEVE